MRSSSLLFLALGAACARPAPAVVVTDRAQLAAAVGKVVTLEGVVRNAKAATLLGVEVDADSPDLRGRRGRATGVLERTVVTKEELERELARRGQFAHRGPGTFYRLVDPGTKRTARARPIP